MFRVGAPWYEQPKSLSRLRDNYSIPGAVVYLPSIGSVAGRSASKTQVTRQITNAGLSERAASTSGCVLLGIVPRLSPGAATYVMVLRRTSSTLRYLAGTVDDGTAYLDHIIVNSNRAEGQSTGNIAFGLRDSAGAFRSQATTSAPIAQNKTYRIVLQIADDPGGYQCLLWVDGVEVPMSGTGSTPRASTGNATYEYAILNRNVRGAITNSATDVDISLFGRFPALLPNPQALSENPWRLFEPRRIWVPVGAAPSTVDALVLSAGALTRNPTAGPGDLKLYLTAAGEQVARTAPAAGDRLLTINASGAWQAGAPA